MKRSGRFRRVHPCLARRGSVYRATVVEGGVLCGKGRTPEAAIADLMRRLEELFRFVEEYLT